MLHKDYDRKCSFEEEKITGHESQRAFRQDELIDGKPPVVNNSDSGSDSGQFSWYLAVQMSEVK
jgi:hypothetical protein